MRSTLYVDISALYETDLRTGIQRVVRAILQELFDTLGYDYCIMPVYFKSGEKGCYFTDTHVPESFMDNKYPDSEALVTPSHGDIFLGLDLHHLAIIESKELGLYEQWAANGVRIHFIVYDLLPVLRPDVFPPRLEELHRKWLMAVGSVANSLIAISSSVRDELRVWLQGSGVMRESLTLSYFHLGADIESSMPTIGLPRGYQCEIETFEASPSFLMVGTVEPRKRHMQVLSAFEKLWARGENFNLIIVGHEGWQEFEHEERRSLPEIVTTLRTHEELGHRLFWLEGISDEYLTKVYDTVDCSISASLGEGFGLPIIEAAKHGIPIIARNIPVFKELCGDSALYFEDSTNSDALVRAIDSWYTLYKRGQEPKSEMIKWLTWRESAQELIVQLSLDVAKKS